MVLFTASTRAFTRPSADLKTPCVTNSAAQRLRQVAGALAPYRRGPRHKCAWPEIGTPLGASSSLPWPTYRYTGESGWSLVIQPSLQTAWRLASSGRFQLEWIPWMPRHPFSLLRCSPDQASCAPPANRSPSQLHGSNARQFRTASPAGPIGRTTL